METLTSACLAAVAPFSSSFNHPFSECPPLPGSSRKRSFLLQCRSHTQEHFSTSAMPRRYLVGNIMSLLVVAASSTPAKAVGEEESTREYVLYRDELDNFSLLVPSDWVKGEGKATGQRKVTAFFPANDTSTNVNVIITGLGADYTSLGSFGTVDSFAETLVNSLDRSWQKPPGQAARLINAKSRNGLYFVDYTLQKPGEGKRVLLSAAGIGFNGWYNRLFTVTGQYWEEEQDKYLPLLEKVVSSFMIVSRQSEGSTKS